MGLGASVGASDPAERCRRFLEATAHLEEGEGAMQDAGSEGDNQRAAGGAALGVEVLANHVRVAPQYSLAALRPGVCPLGRTLTLTLTLTLTRTPTPTPTLTPTLALALTPTLTLPRCAAVARSAPRRPSRPPRRRPATTRPSRSRSSTTRARTSSMSLATTTRRPTA